MQSGLNTQQQNVLDQLLMEAVGKRDLEHVKLYVEKGANVNMNTGTQSQNIRRNGSAYELKREAPLFHYLYIRGFHFGIADYLLSQGVDIDTRDQQGNTVLMLAAKQGDHNTIKYLTERGADPLAANNRGEIVLEEARGLQDYYSSDRQQIIDTLVGAMPTVNSDIKGAQKPAPKPQDAELPAPPPETPLQKRLNNRFNP